MLEEGRGVEHVPERGDMHGDDGPERRTSAASMAVEYVAAGTGKSSALIVVEVPFAVFGI